MEENIFKFYFQTDRKYNVDLRQSYLALECKQVKGRGCDKYTVKEVKKDTSEESATAHAIDESIDNENANSKLSVTYVNNILHYFLQY